MRLVAAIVTLVVVPLGVWVAGGKISNDFRLSMALTAVWFVASGLTALAVAWRWRAFALPVRGAWGGRGGGGGGRSGGGERETPAPAPFPPPGPGRAALPPPLFAPGPDGD